MIYKIKISIELPYRGDTAETTARIFNAIKAEFPRYRLLQVEPGSEETRLAEMRESVRAIIKLAESTLKK